MMKEMEMVGGCRWVEQTEVRSCARWVRVRRGQRVRIPWCWAQKSEVVPDLRTLPILLLLTAPLSTVERPNPPLLENAG